jgi:hypothetical protein
MIVHNLNLPRSLLGPSEANSPLIVDSDAHLIDAIALKDLQSVSGRISQIFRCRRGIELA